MKDRRDKTWLVIWIIIFFVFLAVIISGCNFTTGSNDDPPVIDPPPTQDDPPVIDPPPTQDDPPVIDPPPTQDDPPVIDPPPTQDPPVIDPPPTPIVDDSPKLLVSPTGFGECGPVTTDWILFDDKPYVIWWTSDEPCIGPQKSYLSVFSGNNANADEVSKVELSDLVIAPLSIAIGDSTIYVGGGNGLTGSLAALDLNNLELKWEITLDKLGPDSQSAMIRDVAVTNNSIFVTGDTRSDESSIDMIVIRFDLDGNYHWSEQWGTSCLDWGEEVVPTSNGIDVYAKAGQLCSIMSPDTPPPSVSGDVILHYDY